MINFMAPAMVVEDRPSTRATWIDRMWRRRHPEHPDAPLPTSKILDVIDRVRGAEANLRQLKAEARCDR